MKRHVGACVGLATALLALGYASAGYWSSATASVTLGCLWLLGLHRGWAGTEEFGLTACAAMAAGGASGIVPIPLALASVVAALAAWDLHRFTRRLGNGDRVLHEPTLVRSHMWWSLGVAGVGLLIGLVAPAIQLSLRFGGTLLLGAIAILGVSRAVRWLNHHQNEP
jgi:hypothetical protein